MLQKRMFMVLWSPLVSLATNDKNINGYIGKTPIKHLFTGVNVIFLILLYIKT